MKGIFELTKREQRVIILIIVCLVVIAFAKHWFQTKDQPAHTESIPTPAQSSIIHPEEKQDSR